jgi:hypothetical protein
VKIGRCGDLAIFDATSETRFQPRERDATRVADDLAKVGIAFAFARRQLHHAAPRQVGNASG